VTLVLETLGGDEPLDLRSLGVRLLALTLGLDLAANDELTNVVNFGETKKLADLGGSLGTEPLGMGNISETSDVAVALLDDNEGKDSQVGTDNASTDGFPFALTSTARAVARVSLGKQQAHTSRVHDALLHGETLLVITAGYLKDVAFEFIANAVARDLLAHALLHEDTEAAVIVDFDKLLRAVGGVAVSRSAVSFFRIPDNRVPVAHLLENNRPKSMSILHWPCCPPLPFTTQRQ